MRVLTILATTLVLTLLVASCAGDDTNADNEDDSSDSEQPYAGLQDREIRALSEEEIDDLLAGRGAGYALAAELNSYPGPVHVLDHADDLDLSDEQQEEIQTIFDSMQEDAQELGETLVDLEETLDQRFRQEHIDDDTVFDLTGEIASVEGELRATHLSAHLELQSILSREQIADYDEIRGYDGSADSTETEDMDDHDHGGHS